MEKFSGNQEEPNKHKFDPNDPWDLGLVETGKWFSKMNTDSNAILEEQTAEKLYELGITWEAGGGFKDGFGAWEKTPHGDWVTEKPDHLFTPEEVKEYRNGVRRARIDCVAYGQPDGPDSPGVAWYARLWDQTKNQEIPNSRVFANKLSWVIAGAMQKMPHYGDEIYQTMDQIIRKNLEKEINFLDDIFKELIRDKSDEELSQIDQKLCATNPIFNTSLEYDSFKDWLHALLKNTLVDKLSGNKIMNEIEIMTTEVEKLLPKGEERGDDDEGEEWKKNL